MKSASVTAKIAGNGPERWVRAVVTVRRGLPGFAIHGVCPDAAVEIRHTVMTALAKRGYVLPCERIVADLDFAVPFEGIPELSIALVMALLAATQQIDPSALNGMAIGSKSGRERITLSAARHSPH